MRIIDHLDEMTETARGWLSGGSVGFVPIMSSLHEGHRTLIEAARQENEISVVGILLIPLRLNGGGGLVNRVPTVYARDLTRDLPFLEKAGIDVVFVPQPERFYPPDFSTYVTPGNPLTERLASLSSIEAVREFATLMTKLFLLVRPDNAYFGQKDAQQIAIIRRCVRDLNIDMNLRILPTVRESNGFALSSRNLRLSWTERQAAAVLYQALLQGKALVEKGERRAPVVREAIEKRIAAEPLVQLRYAMICHPDTLVEEQEITPGTLFMVGAQIGDVGLTDNILWTSDEQWII